MRFRLLSTGVVVLLGVGISLPAGGASATVRPATTAPCQAVSFLENASHTGLSCSLLPAKPVQKWSVTLNGPVSYPVIANGRVFVVTGASSGYGGSLYALNQATGHKLWGPIPLSGTYYWWSIAAGDGDVFTNDFSGTISAHTQATGRQLWTTATDYFSGQLTPFDGALYVQGASSVYALAESNGAIKWTSHYLDGDGSSVSANATGVFVAAGCSWFRLSDTTGRVLWSRNAGCSGGGGGTTYLAKGADFETIDSLIVQQTTGKRIGSFAGIPAFSGDDGYFVSGTTVHCENVTDFTPVRSTTLPATATTNPVIAGSVLYVGASNEKIYGVSTRTGHVVWQHLLPGVPGGGDQYSSPVSGIAIGDDLLVVPTGDQLTAFG